MATDLHETVAVRLRRLGQRYTTSRRLVVDALVASTSPLTIPELLAAAGPRLPQSSAYRHVAVLEQAGAVRRLVTSAGFARFELAEDLTEHHHHLICSDCGAVEDFTAPAALERDLGKVIGQLAGSTGFAVDHHRLDLVGTCAACA